MFKRIFSILFILILLQACTSKKDEPASVTSSTETLTSEQMIERGKTIYQQNCLSCHGPDPSVSGPVGPSLAGSSKELLDLRVTNLKYPDGYKPKRSTSLMVAMPHLKKEIPALFQYLNQVTSKK